ncbi:MAG: DUF1330 domain-containing protein [Flavobacteriales bacterium]|nr:DUF1330 domain-containing protein [Flavobacteriales bacterium]
MKNNQKECFEILVGLNVTDSLMYQTYRANMMPILHSYGGQFGYDFIVSEVLISETNHEINRVFTIRFLSKNKMEAFFKDEDYKMVKAKYFTNSVESTTIISSYIKQ